MSLISQKAIPNNKREKPVQEPPAAAAAGSALADADGAYESGAIPESEATVSKKKKKKKKKRSREIDVVTVPWLRKLRKEAGEKVVSGKDYVLRLRAQHAKLNPGTEWANADWKLSGCAEYDDE